MRFDVSGDMQGSSTASARARGAAPEKSTAFRRVLADGSVLLVDATLAEADPETLFDARRWSMASAPRGRGSVHFVRDERIDGVWRGFRRGGLVARLLSRSYLFLGEARVRSFCEFRLLERLYARDLPVPRPLAARYQRHGPWYRADLLTQRIAGATMLSERLPDGLAVSDWEALGRCLQRFHAAGVRHADLNAHNILFSGDAVVHLVDFDRGRILPAGGWAGANLRRLRRSLDKLAPGAPEVRRGWSALCAAYQSAAG